MVPVSMAPSHMGKKIATCRRTQMCWQAIVSAISAAGIISIGRDRRGHEALNGLLGLAGWLTDRASRNRWEEAASVIKKGCADLRLLAISGELSHGNLRQLASADGRVSLFTRYFRGQFRSLWASREGAF